MKSLIPAKYQDEVLHDIKRMQLITCPTTFNMVMMLSLEKLAQHEEFIAYFKNEWINRNSNWYEGANLTTPSHNNALVATNHVIKG